MKGRETKEGKHHRVYATQTQGEEYRNREAKRENESRQEGGKVENRQ